jgi:hypothetical protein
MNPEFMSVENLKYLIDVISSFFKDKYEIDFEKSKINLKNIFFEIMNKINNDSVNNDKTILEKNKLALRIVKEILKNELSVSVNRDSVVYPDRKVIVNSLHSELPKSISNHDVENKLELLENERKNENKTDTPVFEDINKSINDISINEDDFKLKIKELEMNRDKFSSVIQENFVNDETKFIENRNNNMSDILNRDSSSVDPKKFFIQNEVINSLQKNIYPSSYQDLSLQQLNQDEIDYYTDTKFILINSLNRNWLVDKLRYKYKVRFSYSSNEIMKVKFYYNNRTIPFTKTQNYEGIPNINGWYYKGISYPAYDPTQGPTFGQNGKENSMEDGYQKDSFGELLYIGEEDVEIIVDQDASMMGTFTNIKSISITNVTIPTEMVHSFVNTNENNFTNYSFSFPYILCNIEEFNDVYDGTDDNIRRTFCQLQFENYIKTPTGRGFVILKPVQNEVKLFYPTLLSNLPTLNISLIKPNGELINNTEDGIEILNIRKYQNYYLKIQTKTFFEKDAFFKGDYILIRNFSIFNYSNDNDGVNLFNQFINKDNGHMIYEVGEPNEHGYYNSFHIFAPGTFDKSKGIFDVKQEQLDALFSFNEYLENKEHRLSTKEYLDSYENGYILNMSLQNSISMTVEMNKQDPTKLTKKHKDDQLMK